MAERQVSHKHLLLKI